MKLKPLTIAQADQIATHFKPLENKQAFHYPTTSETLIVTHVTIAPFRGPVQDEFKFNFQTGFTLDALIEKYNGEFFTVLVIANILSADNITLTQPYFFDIRELSDRKVNGFVIPPELM